MIDIFTPIANSDVNTNLKELSESLNGLNKAGIEGFVLSQRINSSLFQQSFFSEYKRVLSEIKNKSQVPVYYGPIIRFSKASEFIQLKDNLTINGTRYINIELSSRPSLFTKYFDELRYFIEHADIIPIICGIETYAANVNQKKAVNLLAEMGCLFAVNLKAFTQKKCKKTIKYLIARGHCDLLISGLPPCSFKTQDFKSWRTAAEKFLGKDNFAKCEENSRRVINNKDTIRIEPVPIKKFLDIFSGKE